MIYQLVIYIHVVSAVASIGPFFVLLALVKKLQTAEGQVQETYIKVFQVAVRLVKHAGHALVLSGAVLVISGPWLWTTSWVLMTIVIMFSSIIFLARAFSPTLKKFREPGADKLALVSKLHRSVWMYMLLLMVMLWLMVAKPALW
ncbi:hypothetical protein [Bacillus thermotolerans]|uniref:hypothetical protein n=1 Tax=Bacillus thermotolerans TaxID=1221996 RepID=UPI0005893413|nr:hypothetical protein [Bacillus thermotolerans]